MSSPPSNQGYLSSLSSYSPWNSRSATPKPAGKDADKKITDPPFGPQRGGDHTVQWYHAVDIPKRKPLSQPSTTEAAPIAKKYIQFSERDSRAIEAAFQALVERDDAAEKAKLAHFDLDDISGDLGVSAEDARDTKLRKTGTESDNSVKVPVNEDFLFDVDVERRELAPVYWLGPVYDCRRGTWFMVDGVTLKPCDENLATQLEEGYLKLSPWKFPKTNTHKRSASTSGRSRSRPSSLRLNENPLKARPASGSFVTPKSSGDDLRGAGAAGASPSALPAEAVQRTFRLFGAHMNSVVTYEDESVAWIMTDDFLSGMRGTMYERFAGGAHFAGLKVVRGYCDLTKKDSKDGKVEQSPKVNTQAESGDTEEAPQNEEEMVDEAPPSPSLQRRITLERQMSSLMESGAFDSKERQEEEIRKRDEQEIQDDYKETDEDEQGRDIEHLILVTHGIGQQLGLRFESVNFVHDVNTLRKTLKGVYSGSADLQALNAEVDKPTKNCRIQVLPICWRHLLDFPKQGLKHNRKEHDLGDKDGAEEDVYPSIDDITVNNVFRSLITDLALDILLYQSPAYKHHITRIVLEECNRIYRLFKTRNPNFHGKISLMGHSLGSAIMFDILCKEKSNTALNKRYSIGRGSHRKFSDTNQLGFEVEDFYALGSPVGLFQMLGGRTITARPPAGPRQSQPFDTLEDPFSNSPPGYADVTTSAPKCQRLYNIFHPTDPISYRLEPLISPAMASLKPQPLPYTKRGIFGAPGAGITGIGARVGQSVSGLWSSFSSGIATSLLNRSLGISADDAVGVAQSRAPLSAGAGTNISAGNVIPPGPVAASDAEKLIKGDLAVKDGEIGQHPSTLLDGEIETLYSGFQKANPNPLERDDEKREMEEQARKIKREEGKVRALNANGRVDYSIQEGTFDLSLLGGIASHLSYWAEEDVSHFLISQLLARHRVLRSNSQKEGSRKSA